MGGSCFSVLSDTVRLGSEKEAADGNCSWRGSNGLNGLSVGKLEVGAVEGGGAGRALE